MNFRTIHVSTAKDAAQKANSVIHDHPYESIGVAFGLGLLIGVLVNRKEPIHSLYLANSCSSGNWQFKQPVAVGKNCIRS